MWARVETASGLTPQPAFVSAETAWRMMTQRDPYVNMLRTTIAVTAAGLGGVDAICALPFTLALGLPDRFRAAGGAQHATDPAGRVQSVQRRRSGRRLRRHRALTDGARAVAWKLFQEIEAAGGAAAAIQQGLVQSEVGETRAARQANPARRKDALTGTSDYPNLAEMPAKVLDVKPSPLSRCRRR